MAKKQSLQDQLLKAGLANRKQAVTARKAKNTREKMQRKGQLVVDEVAELADKADAEKREKDKALNLQMVAKAEERAIQAQIDQIVDLNRIMERGDVEFSFTDQAVVRAMQLEDSQRRAVVAGALVIVSVGTAYELIPRKVAKKIAERDPSRLVVMNDSDTGVDIDDEYGDFQVPDDLMW
ncbi:MAG: DUF2058 domain-containing protein [Granulosicoccus sp.]